MQVIWSPLAFQGSFAALTMAVDVTERRRVEHRNAVFSKLSHRLSSATTAPEAAMVICEAADELFKWDDFALDMYEAEKDEVFSLLNVTTVEGKRVEIPSSAQPKTVNVLIQRVIKKGAELLSPEESRGHAASTMLAPIRKGERVIGVLFIQNRFAGTYAPHDLETLQTLADQCSGALERVRAEHSLRESQQRFRDLFENSPDAVFVNDLDGLALDANAAACLLCGAGRDELLGKKGLLDFVPVTAREKATENYRKIVAGELSRIETEIATAEGGIVPVEARAARIEYSGQPAMLFHIRDITERHAAETALRSSETLFRSVWENSVDGMRLTDENGFIVAVNDAFGKMVGLKLDELEGKLFTTIYGGTEDAAMMLKQHQSQFREHKVENKIERVFRLRDGREAVFEIADSFVELSGKPLLLLSLFRDVTLHRRLEEQLRQSQKMEAIGQLAGGVAHDFNNILTVIHGHASLLTASNLDDTAMRSAQQITQASDRAAALTRQLLTFSRRQLIQPKKLDMNKVVGNIDPGLDPGIGQNGFDLGCEDQSAHRYECKTMDAPPPGRGRETGIGRVRSRWQWQIAH